MSNSPVKERLAKKRQKAYIALAAFVFIQLIFFGSFSIDHTGPTVATSDATVEYGETLDLKPLFRAYDDKTNATVTEITVSPSENATVSFESKTAVFKKSGDYSVSIIATDDSGNQGRGVIKVTVTDHTPPQIAGLEDAYEIEARQMIYLNNDKAYFSWGITASDEASDVSLAIEAITPLFDDVEEKDCKIVDGGFVTNVAGEYRVTVTATDACDNTTTAETLVTAIAPPPVQPSPGGPVDTENVEENRQTGENAFPVPRTGSLGKELTQKEKYNFKKENYYAGSPDEAPEDADYVIEPGLYKCVIDPRMFSNSLYKPSGYNSETPVQIGHPFMSIRIYANDTPDKMTDIDDRLNTQYFFLEEGQGAIVIRKETEIYPAETIPASLFTRTYYSGEYMAGLDIVPGTYKLTPHANYTDTVYTRPLWQIYNYVGYLPRIASEGELVKGESIVVEVSDGQILHLRNIIATRIG